MDYAIMETGWGSFGLVARDGALLGTYMLYPEPRMRKLIAQDFPDAAENPQLLRGLQRDIRRYFDGKKVEFNIPLDLDGISPFRRLVLEECAQIPYGEVRSYSELASQAGSPGAARAVGSSMASNRIPLIVPCHRVLRADGTLGGFSSPRGTRLKQKMLDLEMEEDSTLLFSHTQSSNRAVAQA